MKRNILSIIVSGFISGLLIAIGGTVFLSCESKYLGAFLFSVGLFFIVERQYKLYTGAIGYALDNKKEDNINLIFILIGNFIGAALPALILSLTRINPLISEKAVALVTTKLNDAWYSVLILSIFCGILIYLGVDTFRKASNPVSKVLAILLCIVVFILSSYEHCIANMYYITMAKMWSMKPFLYILLMIVGNSIGGLLIPSLRKLIKD